MGAYNFITRIYNLPDRDFWILKVGKWDPYDRFEAEWIALYAS